MDAKQTTTKITTVTTTGENKVEATLIGDANEDGYVNMGDVTSIIQHIGNQDTYGLPKQRLANAELCDNVKGITGMDAIAIQYLLASQIDKLPYIE